MRRFSVVFGLYKLLRVGVEQLEQSICAIIGEAGKGGTVGAKQKIKELIPEYTPCLG